jgi:predicted nucleic acid-binding protein
MNSSGAIPPLPPWLRVEVVQNLDQAKRFARIVDVGEAEAIELALELHADRLLIDERKGRQLASKEGIPVLQHAALDGPHFRPNPQNDAGHE